MTQRKSKGDESLDPKALFGQRLKELRRRAGISQEHLADLAGLDRTYISGVERGKRNISLENICRIAKALNVDPGNLLKGLRSRNWPRDDR